MKKIRSNILFAVLSVAAAIILVVPSMIFADDQDQTRDRIRGGQHLEEPIRLQLRLRDQIQDDTGLSGAQLDKLNPLLEEAINLNGGDTEPVREMVRKAVGEDCVNDCLMERLRTRNREMARERKRLLKAEGNMTRERTRERSRERSREPTEEQNQEGNVEGSGSDTEGGKGR